MNKKGSIRNIIILILILIIVGLGFYILCDNGIIFNDNDKEFNYEELDDTNKTKDVKVITLYSFNGEVDNINDVCPNASGKANVSVNLPKIDSDSPNAILLNNKILSDFDVYTKMENGTSFNEVNLYYTSLIKDNYIYIYVEARGTHNCGSGDTIYKSYYYDIENDSIMNSEKAFVIAGFTLQNLKDIGGTDFKTCDEITCGGCGLKIENNKLVPYYYDMCI